MPGIEIKGRSKRANYRHGRLVELEPKSVDGKGKKAIKYETHRPPQRKLKRLEPGN